MENFLMAILDTINLLQGIHKSIDGVKTCPSRYPGSLNAAELPAVIVWPGGGDTEAVTSRFEVRSTTREYLIRCFMEPFGKGDYDTAPRDGMELLTKFLDTYTLNPILSDGYTKIVSIRDSGIIAGTASLVGSSSLSYAGIFYKGFTMNISVIEVF